MKILATVAIALGLASVAHADAIVPPVGWQSDTAKATDQAARLRKLPHFAGAPTEFGASVFVAPVPGIVLYLSRLSTTANNPDAIRATLDDFELPTRESGVQVGDTTKHVDDAKKEIQATIGVRDRGAQLVTISALIAAADAKHLVVVTGDCIARDDLDPKLLEACRLALATLDADIKLADRVAIALPPAGEQLPPTPEAQGSSASSSSSSPGTGSHMSDGSRMVMPPIVVPLESQSDRRPLFIGAGLVVLAAAFWWNRKRRERFAREDRGEPPEPERQAERGDDPDADALHAAAAGDDTKADDAKGDDKGQPR